MEAILTRAVDLLFSQGGILGVVVVGVTWALVFAVKGWHACWTGRLTDRDAAQAIIIKVAEDQAAALTASTQVMAERTQAVQSLTASNLEQATAMRHLAEKVEMQTERVLDRITPSRGGDRR